LTSEKRTEKERNSDLIVERKGCKKRSRGGRMLEAPSLESAEKSKEWKRKRKSKSRHDETAAKKR